MALATQCPHCHTTFRVAHDQLKLRAGLVRCGACKQIFNGIENLLRSEDQPGAIASAPTPAPVTSAVRTDMPASAALAAHIDPPPSSTGDDGTDPARESEAEPMEPPLDKTASLDDAPADDGDAREHEVHDEATAPPRPANESHDEEATQPRQQLEDPLLRMTLMDFRDRDEAEDEVDAVPAEDPGQSDPLEQAIEDLQRKPLRGRKHRTPKHDTGEAGEPDASNDGFEEPSFVRQGRRRRRMGHALRITMAVGSILLLIVLLAQSAYVFRNQLAARFPNTKPLLLQVCAYLDCQVGLPAQIDAVSIESNELQTLAPNSNTFVLTILLRNHGAIAQAWPHIELTLNDSGEKALVRRVFAPAEYLPEGVNARLGFAPQSEQPLRLFFELDDLKASGYRVYLFYP